MKITVYFQLLILVLLGSYFAGGTSALAEIPDIYETPPSRSIPADSHINIQYSLDIIETHRGSVPSDIGGIVTDALSGTGIPNASLHLTCENRTIQSCAGGQYAFTGVRCNTGLLSIHATASGYRPISCHFPFTNSHLGFLEYIRNIKMLPNHAPLPNVPIGYRNSAERLLTSKSFYNRNETLTIYMPWVTHASMTGVPADECVNYYFALAYPPNGQRIEVISGRNQTHGAHLVPWSGDDGDSVWHKSTAGMSVGQYALYLLRMPAYNDPNTQMGLGELTQPHIFTIY